MMNKWINKILIIAGIAVLFSPHISMATDTSVSAFLSSGAYNNLVSDASFIDTGSMDVAAIQAFFVSNNSYLKDFSEGGKSAAQIIYDASHGAYDAAVGTAKGISITSQTGTISPRLILVFLQKEQSLVTRTDRDDNSLNKAMGYQCPDGGGCDPAYAGFAMQVGWGAWQLRYNYEAASKGVDWWNTNYGSGNDSICYVNQTKTINDYTGSYSITFANAATASVYRYTPHVFDSAYNVWSLFNTWFTASTPASTGNDIGAWSKTTYQSSITLSGTKASDTKAYFNDQLIADTGTTNWQITFEAPIGNNSFAVIYKDANGTEINRKMLQVNRRKTADINGDGAIDSTELSILADSWNRNVDPETAGDMNGDGIVDSTDLSILADAWGK